MYCPNCACELPAVAKFCVRCGSRIELSRDNPQVGQTNIVPPPPGEAPSSITPEPTIEARRAKFSSQAENAPTNVHAIGSHFVVPPGGVLPNRCVKCGGKPSDPWLNLTFSWHHPLLYFLLISPIIYVIVAAVVVKRVTLAVPLCAVHKSIRKKRLWTGWVLLILCIPLPVAMASYIGNDAATTLAVWIGLALFIVGIGFLRAAAALRATHIGPSAEFRGACPEFLDSMQQAPEYENSMAQLT